MMFSKIKPQIRRSITFGDSLLIRACGTIDSDRIFTIIVIGPPRSGSTLVYQTLCACYALRTYTNLQARFSFAPAFALLVERVMHLSVGCKIPMTDFKSKFGRTRGWLEAHEGGAFWNRWFSSTHPVLALRGSLSAPQLHDLQRTIAAMTRLGGRPLVFKNVYNSLRLGVLAEAFPSALFLVCRREHLDIAKSILRARRHLNIPHECDWSVSPPGADLLNGRPEWDRIAAQIVGIYEQIDRDANEIGRTRFIDISYEALCRSPLEVLHDLEAKAEAVGFPLRRTGDPPTEFRADAPDALPDDDVGRLRQALDQIGGLR